MEGQEYYNIIPAPVLEEKGKGEELDKLSKKISDPRSFGPGLWFRIHKKAAKILLLPPEEVEQKIMDFIVTLWEILKSIPCGECRGHALEYIDKTPPEARKREKDSRGRSIGMFRWTWIFHESVNSRLGKDPVNWVTALALYDNEDPICSSSCSPRQYHTIKR